MAESLDKLRQTIEDNRAAGTTATPVPTKTIYVNRKAELLLAGEVIDGTAEELSVVQQETFAT